MTTYSYTMTIDWSVICNEHFFGQNFDTNHEQDAEHDKFGKLSQGC